MLSSSSSDVTDGGGGPAAERVLEWMHIDRKLRAIARKRSALDAAEAKLLRDADRVAIWREFACVSILDYMERVLGYGPKAAQDRTAWPRHSNSCPR